jgi:hypothetical protein
MPQVQYVLLGKNKLLVEGESTAIPYFTLAVANIKVLNGLGNS